MTQESEQFIDIEYEPQNYQENVHLHPARFKVIIRGRRGGKTEEEIQGVSMDAVINPGLHWLVGPNYRQIKSIAWTRLKSVLRVDPDWNFNESELSAVHKYILDDKGNPTKIELKGADNPDSLVGVALRSLRLDEAALMKREVWTKVLRPMLADYKAPAYFYSTPRGKNWIYDLWCRGNEGHDKDWKSWRQPTEVNKYISPSEIADAKKDMSDRLFRQEFLAEFLDDETGVFKRVRACIVGELKKPILGRFYMMGVDLAKTTDFTVLTVMDTVTREVVHFERFNQIEWREQKLRIQKLASDYNNAMCVIDGSGVGDPIVEDLMNAGLSLYYQDGKPGVKFTNDRKTQLIEQLVIAIEQRQITFPKELEILIDELMQYEYFITDHGNIKYGAPEGKHDDCVISLALAVWGARTYLYEAQAQAKTVEQDPQDRQGRGEVLMVEEPIQTYSGY